MDFRLRFIPSRVVSFGLGVSTILLFCLYWRERRNARRRLRLSSAAADKVLFFPDSSSGAANKTGALKELFSTLESARSSLDVCVFAISNWNLIDILISAHQRGIIVRVITDKDQMTVNPSPVEKLRRNGIQVRNNNNAYFMHHKFAVVDKRCLVNGSLNWTQQAVYGNKENIVISSSSDTVRPFLKQFECLWDQFHPQNYCPSDLQ